MDRCQFTVGIDARLPVARGRGWGRYAEEFLWALVMNPRCPRLRILLPDQVAGAALGERLQHVAEARGLDEQAFRRVLVPFVLPPGDAYLDRALDPPDPMELCGPVDILHSLTRFAVRTSAPCTVATVHDIAPLADPPTKLESLRMTCRALEGLRSMKTLIIAVSEATRRDLVERAGFDVQRVRVVTPGVSEQFVAEMSGSAAGDGGKGLPWALLTVGGAGENKNLERLVEAVAVLRRSHPVDLTMVGARQWGYEALERRLAARLGSNGLPLWLRILDRVSDEELAALYQRTFVVVPSLHEGFGLPILEAMASGASVACSDIPVFRDVAGEAAFFFDPRDPGDIARTLAAALRDEEGRKRRILLGRERAGGFRWEHRVSSVIALYELAIGQRGGGVSAGGSAIGGGDASTPSGSRDGRGLGRSGQRSTWSKEPIDIGVIAYSSECNDRHDHFDLIDRCLSSLLTNTTPGRFRLLVGCNRISPRVRRRLDQLSAQAQVRCFEGEPRRDPAGVIVYPKYPLMGRMMKAIRSEWFVWLDDDSHLTADDWLDALLDAIAAAEGGGGSPSAPRGIAQLGKLADVPLMNPPGGWIKQASWYNPHFEHELVVLPDGSRRIRCSYIVGGFFAMQREAMHRCAIPDPRLFHNGGDWTTGLALAHGGYGVAGHRYGVAINDAPRRGMHADRWYPPGQAAALQAEAIRADRIRFEDTIATPAPRVDA